jgi:glutamyl-tRNA reductase
LHRTVAATRIAAERSFMPESPAGAIDRYIVVGLSHDAAPGRVHPHLFTESPDLDRFLGDLRAAGFEQGTVIATCERVEVATLADDVAQAESHLRRLMAAWSGLDTETLAPCLRVVHAGHALRHLFAVASALDSAVPGDPDVPGQVRAALRAAQAHGMLGSGLDAAFQAAFGVAKRVRSETALGEKPVSIAAAAVQVAGEIHGDLKRTSLLMVGLGEVSELMAWQFRASGVGRLTIAHPTERRAESVAARQAAHVHPWSDLDSALPDADIVVAALGEGRYTITREQVRRALKKRRQRPMFLVDAAVPGDIDPGVDAFDAAFRYEFTDLERIAATGLVERETAALDAWRILDAELDAFQARQQEREAVPTLVALREHAEAVRAEVLADGKLDAEAATRKLLQRLLHTPTRTLRRAARESEADRAELEAALRRLFALDDAPDMRDTRAADEDQTTRDDAEGSTP